MRCTKGYQNVKINEISENQIRTEIPVSIYLK